MMIFVMILQYLKRTFKYVHWNTQGYQQCWGWNYLVWDFRRSIPVSEMPSIYAYTFREDWFQNQGRFYQGLFKLNGSNQSHYQEVFWNLYAYGDSHKTNTLALGSLHDCIREAWHLWDISLLIIFSSMWLCWNFTFIDEMILMSQCGYKVMKVVTIYENTYGVPYP